MTPVTSTCSRTRSVCAARKDSAAYASSISCSTGPIPRSCQKWSMTVIRVMPAASAFLAWLARVRPRTGAPPLQVKSAMCRPSSMRLPCPLWRLSVAASLRTAVCYIVIRPRAWGGGLGPRGMRRAPGGRGRGRVVIEGRAAPGDGAGLEPEPRAGGGGVRDGDRHDGHQAGIAGPGRAGQPDGARRVYGDDDAAVRERPGQALRGRGVLVAVGVGREDIPERLAQPQQGAVFRVAQACLLGQQRYGAEPAGRVLAGAQQIGVPVGAQRVSERQDTVQGGRKI